MVTPNRPKKRAKVLQKMHMCKFFLEKMHFWIKKFVFDVTTGNKN